MSESVVASVVFWVAFGVTPGPFWTAIMEQARHTSLKSIYIEYCKYLIVGWLSVNAAIGVIVGILGGISPAVVDLLYFPGAAVICYFGWKVLQPAKQGTGTINFHYKAMTVLTWSNPKVWLLVPSGFLSANYTSSVLLNIIIFFLLGVPIFLACLFCWAMIGRQGARLVGNRIGYFNALLFFCFALYLLYQGVERVL